MTPAVRAMLDDPRAPTPPVCEFIEAYDEDDNIWWRTPVGHLQNLFDALRDECDALITEVNCIKREEPPKLEWQVIHTNAATFTGKEGWEPFAVDDGKIYLRRQA